MSETIPVDPIEMLNEIGLVGEDELSTELRADYAFLGSKFGPIVRQEHRTYADNGKMHHEFVLQVGDAMQVAAAMGDGCTLDIGGPSPYKNLKTVRGQFKPSIVTNSVEGPGVDDVLDVHDLHYPSNSFSMVVGMSLPGRSRLPDERFKTTVRSAFIKQAYRILEPGGWMLMTAVTKDDLTEALDQGFTLEAGNGAVVAGISMTEIETNTLGKLYANMPRLVMEILLHK